MHETNIIRLFYKAVNHQEYTASVRDAKDSIEHWWNYTDRIKRNNFQKSLSLRCFVRHNPHMDWPAVIMFLGNFGIHLPIYTASYHHKKLIWTSSLPLYVPDITRPSFYVSHSSWKQHTKQTFIFNSTLGAPLSTYSSAIWVTPYFGLFLFFLPSSPNRRFFNEKPVVSLNFSINASSFI